VGAFVVGYFVNAVSSLMEDVYNWTIGGKPSDKLLRINPDKNYNGTWKVKFYQTKETIALLKKELGDKNASEDAMFKTAMRIANGEKETRVSDFNAHYAFARTMLTAMLIITVILLVRFPCNWQAYLSFISLVISWERYKERGYYYAREVLNVYLNYQKKTE